MEYPFWYVPLLGAPMLIPVVALVHVAVSHFAVGGGILLWLGIRRARIQDDPAFMGYLKRLTRFFVLLTVVFGAITGVGIWWTIGLASPQATSTLIHAFVFGWAAEWVTFVVELVAAFGLFYLWDRLAPRRRETVAAVYAGAAWLSLVLITGITAFMASSGSWPETRTFQDGFLNPTFLPSVVARTGGSLALTGLYVFLHVSFVSVEEGLRARVIAWASRWAMAGMAGILAGGLWWFLAAPDYIGQKLLAAPAILVISVVAVGATLVLLGAVAFGSRLGSGWMVPTLAVLLFIMGTTGLFSGEFLREAGRKPYTVERYLYSTNVRTDQVDEVRRRGYVNAARWPRAHLERAVPALYAGGRATAATARALTAGERRTVGRVIYENQCGVCHTHYGYNAVMPRLTGASRELVRVMVTDLHGLSHAMPPWAGQTWEIDLVVDYLHSTATGSAAAVPTPGGDR